MGEDFLTYDLTSNVRRPVGKRDNGEERQPYWGWAHLDNKVNFNEPDIRVRDVDR